MGILFGWIARHVQEHRAEQLAIAQLHASTSFDARAIPANGIAANGSISIPIFL
jgi:hypothetical protein